MFNGAEYRSAYSSHFRLPNSPRSGLVLNQHTLGVLNKMPWDFTSKSNVLGFLNQYGSLSCANPTDRYHVTWQLPCNEQISGVGCWPFKAKHQWRSYAIVPHRGFWLFFVVSTLYNRPLSMSCPSLLLEGFSSSRLTTTPKGRGRSTTAKESEIKIEIFRRKGNHKKIESPRDPHHLPSLVWYDWRYVQA